MDENISVGHPFYFPTQVVLLDDDPDFLDGISLMLNKNLAYKLFQSANGALKYVNAAHQHVHFLQRCYTNYKTGPLESDSLSHIDIGKLHLEVLNGFRFQTCSTVIVDYSMPEMNGLEFLMALKNPFIRKVLLTGQADMELAIKAFNQQLIDQFIDKHDPRLKQKLNATIASFQDQYFRTSFKLITDPIIANNHDGFLVNREFQHFFAELRSQLGCVEYYMLDVPHSGFLMVDTEGKRHCLLIYTQEALSQHYQQLCQLKAPEALLRQVRSGAMLPGYDIQAVALTPEHRMLTDWEPYYFPARKVGSATPIYYTTLTGDEQLPGINGKQLYSYSDFLETNSLVQQIMH
jgi:CheY-like chemotaxis protein